jgi:hypothetical protein
MDTSGHEVEKNMGLNPVSPGSVTVAVGYFTLTLNFLQCKIMVIIPTSQCCPRD